MVLSNAATGTDEEFNRWYSDVHIPEILQLPSFVSARRYRLDQGIPARTQHSYLAIYEVTDAERAASELRGARSGLTMSSTLDQSTVVQGYYESIVSSEPATP
jgi:hypothetical protein